MMQFVSRMVALVVATVIAIWLPMRHAQRSGLGLLIFDNGQHNPNRTAIADARRGSAQRWRPGSNLGGWPHS